MKIHNVPTDSPVGQLITEIEKTAESKGLHLSRWETSSRYSGFLKTIVFAVHTGQRPKRSRDAHGDMNIILYQPEGKTAKCIAFRKLESLLQSVQNYNF